jgi:hypothetical protein
MCFHRLLHGIASVKVEADGPLPEIIPHRILGQLRNIAGKRTVGKEELEDVTSGIPIVSKRNQVG